MPPKHHFVEPDPERQLVTVRVNPKLYPVDLIYSAAYTLMDKAYVMLDGSLEETVFVILKPRNPVVGDADLEKLGQTFYDELTAAAFYAVQLSRNQGVREALLTGLANSFPATEESEEDIAKIWEEKFGEVDEGCDDA
ncbi:MAG TPA: hypothetical protein ENN60_02950 [archaeon]|nr:hypothetical protein [archaeon]